MCNDFDWNLLNNREMRKGQKIQNCYSTPKDHKCRSGFVFTPASQQPCLQVRISMLAPKTVEAAMVLVIISKCSTSEYRMASHSTSSKTKINAGQILFTLRLQKLKYENLFFTFSLMRICVMKNPRDHEKYIYANEPTSEELRPSMKNDHNTHCDRPEPIDIRSVISRMRSWLFLV